MEDIKVFVMDVLDYREKLNIENDCDIDESEILKMSDEDFMTISEEQDLVYSLKDFEEAMNHNHYPFERCYIRILGGV